MKEEINAGKLQNDIEELTKLAEERLKNLRYLQADFDNYRKQFEKEKLNIIKLANENLIKELIIILDDFENALNLIENEKNNEGLKLLHKKFFKTLENNGLKQIEALGKKFDPNFHEVLMKEISEAEEGTILEEIQKGFMLQSKVIRPSKVKISYNQGGKENE
jgi:molecular chaperone GrpE